MWPVGKPRRGSWTQDRTMHVLISTHKDNDEYLKQVHRPWNLHGALGTNAQQLMRRHHDVQMRRQKSPETCAVA